MGSVIRRSSAGLIPIDGGILVTPKGGSADDSVAIQAAINRIASSGRAGKVQLVGDGHRLSNKIKLASKVTVRGAGWDATVLKGTVLVAQGAPHDCFVWNDTPLTVQPSAQAILASTLQSPQLIDMAFDGFNRPVHIGDVMNTGSYYGKFERLFSNHHTGWGFYFENCGWFNRWDTLSVNDSLLGGIGGMHFGSSQVSFNNGNAVLTNLFVGNVQPGLRGIEFLATEGGFLNDINVLGIQCDAGGYSLSQVGTATGTADITVTDGAAFLLDLPVTINVLDNTYQFLQRQMYFVVSQIGNVIQLSDTMRGPTKIVTGSWTFVSFGFPSLVIAGVGTSIIQPSTFLGIDVEGNASTQILVQKAQVNLGVGTSNGATQDSTNYSVVCARGSAGICSTTSEATFDIDSTSAYQMDFSGNVAQNAAAPWVQHQGIGIFNTPSNHRGLALLPYPPNKFTLEDTGENFIKANMAIGQATQVIGSPTMTLNYAYYGILIAAPSVNQVLTLPPLSTALMGLPITVVYATTVAGTTVTLNTAAGDNFGNDVTKTSYVLSAQQKSIQVVAVDDGTLKCWAVLANNGAV